MEKIPKPFLKWVGGKQQILNELLKSIPKNINNYYELFLGGGSFLMMILWANKNNLINISGTINVYDLNTSLIGTYNNIKNNKEQLVTKIKTIINEFNNLPDNGDVKRKNLTDSDLNCKETYYYWIRQLFNTEDNKTSIVSSAYFIFLNKTGFRGMYREGPNGYNVPYGNYKNPKIIDEELLDCISLLIQNVNFYNYDFSKSFKSINGINNFIYLDPPYAPENNKSFVSYTKNGFDIKQHKLLFELTKNVSNNNMIMMSNSNVELVKNSLSPNNYKYKIISCKRCINSKNPSSKTDEVIITNY